MYGVGGVCVGEYWYVWPLSSKASWVPRFAAIIGVSDSPLAAVEVTVAYRARGVGVWDPCWLHDSV